MELTCKLFVRCLRSGRDEDWRELMKRTEEQVRWTVQREMERQGARNAEDLDDYVQVLYLRLLSRVRGFCGRSDAELWCYLGSAARHVVIDGLRASSAAKRCLPDRVAPRGPTSDRFPLEPFLIRPRIPSPEERVLLRERLTLFARGCRHLVQRRRGDGRLKLRILRLAYVEGMSSEEISGALRGRVSPSQVNSLIHRLRCSLADAGVRLARRPYASV